MDSNDQIPPWVMVHYAYALGAFHYIMFYYFGILVMSIDLKEWLNSINLSKEHMMEEDPDVEKEYPPFIINKCLSGQMDSSDVC